MKTKAPILVAALCGLALPATSFAQVLTGPSGGGGTTSTTTQPDGTTVVNREQPRGDKPFLGTDVPVFNPGTEIFSWDGQNWNVTNNRLMRARFEKYLNTLQDDAEEDQQYREVIKEILVHINGRFFHD